MCSVRLVVQPPTGCQASLIIAPWGKDAADNGRTPASSSAPAVLGPFEDLLDLQIKADIPAGQDGDGAAGVAGAAAKEDGKVAADGEADADAAAQEDEDAASDQAPDDDDDGYLSDDSDEHLEPTSLGSIIDLKRFSLTLLVPFNRKPEVKRTAVTVAALLDDWKDQLSPDVLQTTTYQELTVTYFSGVRYGRLQVTFNHNLSASPYTILLGDLNIVADPVLDKSSKLGTPAENQRLLQICSRWDMQDAFRCLHPTRKEYTFFSRSAKTSTRIDRVLVSHSLLNCVTEAKHRMVPYGLTDHWFAVSVSLKAASADDHGPGLWRLQAPHAGGEGVRNIISAVLASQANCPDQGLERLVTCLRASMRAHVAEERKRVKATMVHLEQKVEELRWKVMSDRSSQALYEELVRCEVALKLYQDSNKERLQVLTGMMLELAGETPSGFLSGLVKSRKAKTEIAELTFKGVLRKGASEVLQAASEHFREAYALSPTSSPVEPWPIEEGRTLQECDRRQLDSEWSEQEVKVALKGLPAGKAPGQDGLPKEFFERNWELLGPAVMKEVRTFESTGVLSESFTTAVTILLHKKGDRGDLGNYRPITLLSFFYKLLAKVLANRIKVVLPKVISGNQFGFLPGRSLADAVSLVADAIDAAEQEDEDWLLLLVDFQKAYDSVSRDYLFTTLGNVGFSEKFTRWVKGLHDGAATRVLLNGWIGERVEMDKGVRQGCPLAPYLFLCAVEPFCQEIERRKLGVRKRGVKGSLDYIGYADDTTLVLKGKEQVVVAEKLLGEFAEISGLKVNRDKTTLMPLGKNLRRLQPITSSFKWAEKNASKRLLGIWITSGGSPGPAWDKAFEKVSAVLSCWESKHLKTSARVTIINCYVMPILLFQAQIYAPLYDVWTKVKRLCHNFISGGKALLDKHFTLWSYELSCRERKEGGLGVIDLRHRIDSMVIQGLGKALAEQEPLRNWLWERAAAFPLGLATVYAHPSILKTWLGGGTRWKATIKTLWDSKLVVIGDSAHRWDAEGEQLLFNRNIFFRGRSPFGNQAGSLCLKDVRLGDLVVMGGDGSRSRKSEEVLERELGGVEQRKWALKAWDATPQSWKDLVLKQLSVEEVFRESRLVRSSSYRPGEFFYYQLQYVSNGELYGRRVTVDKKGNIGEVEYASVGHAFAPGHALPKEWHIVWLS
ncbi:unnamed protein product [Closterium sp. Yama58-4]|nr:unnamed protein product [Closterium sp. Yama58-4]